MVVRSTTYLREGFGATDGQLILATHFCTLTVLRRWELRNLDASYPSGVCKTHFWGTLTIWSSGVLVRVHVNWAWTTSQSTVLVRAHSRQGWVLALVCGHLSMGLLEASIHIIIALSNWLRLPICASHHVEDLRESLSIFGNTLVRFSER
jgi:hypothetical protein